MSGNGKFQSDEGVELFAILQSHCSVVIVWNDEQIKSTIQFVCNRLVLSSCSSPPLVIL